MCSEVSKIAKNGYATACAGRHSVHFYQQDSTLIEAIRQHFAPALAAGDTAILVATGEHGVAVAEALARSGLDLPALRANQRYIEMNAGDTLEKFMLQGWPDAEKFMAAVGRKIARAEAMARGHRVVIFGEMVALLYEQGMHKATIRLEQLWNDFAERHSVFLLCAYPLRLFSHHEHQQIFLNICGEHTTVNPADTHSQRENGNKCRLMFARPRQKAGELEEEIRLSQERVLLLQKATSAGTWELDLATGTLSVSSAAAKLLKLTRSQLTLSAFLGTMYYSGDRDAVAAGLEDAHRSRRNFAAGFRVSDGGSTRLLEIRGRTFYRGASPIMVGVLLDVTPSAA